MKKSWMAASALALLLGACANQGPPGGPPPQPMPGADLDGHGCKPSAGFAWCDRLAQCVRPWELARSRGLPAGPEAVSDYCGTPSTAQPLVEPGRPQ
ncbi:hypothetical protein [Bordetella genomosp. 1]|uniref:hypothetical protein n=1 Tax=Bordetella genomosp. 1 TaxID=1395607 RepID=UPI00211AB7C3|nr:hypothetical protein [Bordetella genomosp. 1]